MKFKITSPDGRSVTVSGNSAPSEAEIDEIFSSIPTKEGTVSLPQEAYNIDPNNVSVDNTPKVVKDIVSTMKREGRTKPTVGEYGRLILGATGEASRDALKTASRMPVGLTGGLLDYATKDLGDFSTEKWAKDVSDKYGTVGDIANFSAELVGGYPTAVGLEKGAGTILSKIPTVSKGAKLGSGLITSGVLGGTYGLANGTPFEGVATGLGTDIALRGASKLFRRLYSPSEATIGVKPTLAGAVRSDKGQKLLDRASRADNMTARMLKEEAPTAYNTINNEALDVLERGLGNKVDPEGMRKAAGKAKEEFLSNNTNNQIFGIPDKNLLASYQAEATFNPNFNYTRADAMSALEKRANNLGKEITNDIGKVEKTADNISVSDRVKNPTNGGYITPDSQLKGIIPQNNNNVNIIPKNLTKGMDDFEKDSLQKAWTEGKRRTTSGYGTVGHIDQVNRVLNDMIEGAKVQNPVGVGTQASELSRKLSGVKERLMGEFEKNSIGLRDVNKQYAQAMAVKDAYNTGLKYNPNDFKTRKMSFKTPEEQSAFAQGVVERATMNPETKNIAKSALSLRGILEKVLPKEKVKSTMKALNKLDESYGRVEKIEKNANRRLGTDDPLPRPASEKVETLGAILGTIQDFANTMATKQKLRKAVTNILDSNYKQKVPLLKILEQYVPLVSGMTAEEATKGE